MPRKKNSENSKRVTLRDIAQVAGVHVMTVSDALRGNPRVAAATRERVEKIAQELNYVPNFAARALTTGRTGIIAVLSGPINEAYHANMVHLLEEHINGDGYKVLHLRSPREVKDMLTTAGDSIIDGAIAVDTYHFFDEFCADRKVPLVSIGTFSRNATDHVVIDLSEAIEYALGLMVRAGRKRIAYLVPESSLANRGEARTAAYLRAMHNAERAPEIIDVSTTDLSVLRERLGDYIRTKGCPDGLLCQNDDTAMRVFRVLRDLGVKVPDDVLLLGCDGQPGMEYFDPPLSTVVQPMEKVCAAAWKFLKRRIAKPNVAVQRVTYQGKLAVRVSLVPTKATKRPRKIANLRAGAKASGASWPH
ncbi:LacI family transcriptional regulator [bacterium]|nr:MAG: LacI family transcriptional regulator [bacterium]